MSTGRVIWLIWCLAWAAFWFFAGFATLGVGFLLAAGSVGAFWLPVGRPPARSLPPGWELPPIEQRREDRP